MECYRVMDTLGSLCDKLTIVVLKKWHAIDTEALSLQEKQLQDEIDHYLLMAFSGLIPKEQLTFPEHKSLPPSNMEAAQDIGSVISQLATVNCEIWHEVDKSYHPELLTNLQKELLIKHLVTLNMDRNRYKEAIDDILSELVP